MRARHDQVLLQVVVQMARGIYVQGHCGARRLVLLCVPRPVHVTSARARVPVDRRDLQGFTHPGPLMSRTRAPRNGEDAVGERRVLAAEVMAPADLLACDAGR